MVQEVALGSARPSVTKKQREQKKRERQAVKAEKRAQKKIDAQNPTERTEESEFEYPEDLYTPT
ncbi:MAG: hypothetical protein ACXVIJ_08175 [Thermoanaerobaculia bacterium]